MLAIAKLPAHAADPALNHRLLRGTCAPRASWFIDQIPHHDGWIIRVDKAVDGVDSGDNGLDVGLVERRDLGRGVVVKESLSVGIDACDLHHLFRGSIGRPCVAEAEDQLDVVLGGRGDDVVEATELPLVIVAPGGWHLVVEGPRPDHFEAVRVAEGEEGIDPLWVGLHCVDEPVSISSHEVEGRAILGELMAVELHERA